MSRSNVKHEWAEMLTRGIVPVMEIDDDRGQVVVNVQLCEQGVWFDWDWEVEIDRPRFDGPSAGFVEGGWSPLRRSTVWGTAWTRYSS